MGLDWDSLSSAVLFNPRLPEAQRKPEVPLAGSFAGHFWFATSSATKWVALSKKALLLSATAVNRHLKSDRGDVWANPLPYFHVGGAGIEARSYLSGARVLPFKGRWDPSLFCRFLREYQVTLTACVPTQLFDLIRANCRPPPSLRAIIVGGGAVGELLFLRATELGWPLYLSYGLTECSSQVATAEVGERGLSLLSHVEVALEKDGRIRLKSDALLTAYFDGEMVYDPKENGWFQTEDLGCFEGGKLQLLGRVGEMIKIGGESVNLAYLRQLLEQCRIEMGLDGDCALFAVDDLRLGKAIHLATAAGREATERLLGCFHQRVAPFERVRSIEYCQKIPRSPIGKLLIGNMLKNS